MALCAKKCQLFPLQYRSILRFMFINIQTSIGVYIFYLIFHETRLHNIYSPVKFLIRPISRQSGADQKFLTWEGYIMMFKYTCIFKTTPSLRVMADDSMTRSVRRRKGSSKLTGVSQLFMCLKVAHYLYTTLQIENTSIYLYLVLLPYDSQLYLINLQLHIMLKHAEIKVKYTNAIKNLVRISH